jgi:tetratricopeptide (TPR) repeat protein
MCYFSLLEFERSLHYLHKALSMRQQLYLGDTHADVCMSLNNVGVSYYYAGELTRAADYLEQSLAMRRALYRGTSDAVAEAEKSLGTVYMEAKDWARAVEHFEACLRIRNNNGIGEEDEEASSELYRDLANCYIKLEQYTKAAEFIPKQTVDASDKSGQSSRVKSAGKAEERAV